MGPNGMHPHLLREVADVTARSILIIFDQSWQLEEVPEDWGKAIVTSIFKKDKKEDQENYRLVSLTSNPVNRCSVKMKEIG